MPPIGSVTGGFGVMMDAVSTCTRLLREGTEPSISVPVLLDIYPVFRRMSVSTIETYATTFERVKRISRDCSSLECAERIRTCTFYAVLPTVIKRNRTAIGQCAPYYTTAHHTLIYLPDIYVGNISAQRAKPN